MPQRIVPKNAFGQRRQRLNDIINAPNPTLGYNNTFIREDNAQINFLRTYINDTPIQAEVVDYRHYVGNQFVPAAINIRGGVSTYGGENTKKVIHDIIKSSFTKAEHRY
jgi:hypothetical protein